MAIFIKKYTLNTFFNQSTQTYFFYLQTKNLAKDSTLFESTKKVLIEK